MFGNIAQMMDLMKRAGEIKEKIRTYREEAGNNEYTASSGGDMVEVVVTGDFQVKRVTIAPEALADRELLEDLVRSAMGNALSMAKTATQEALKEATGGLDIADLL